MVSRRRFLAAAGVAPLAAGYQPVPRKFKTQFAVNVETWWRDLSFLERLDHAAAAGFPAIEFWPWRGKDIEAIAAKTRELGLVVTQFTAWGFEPGMNDPGNHDAVVSEIEASCGAAKTLGARWMTVVAGDDQPGMSQDEMHENVIIALKRVAPIAERHDVTLILEPMNIRVDHQGHCLYGSAPAIRIVEAVGSSHVKINWDLYHLQITEGDLCGHLAEGIEHIGYVQLADHPGRNEPGTGEVHYNRVLKELDRLGYRGYVGLELNPLQGEEAAADAVASADVW
ncbi:MAG TPA: TIM barrel protein [Vicinamibacteria bacterium]|nr:TIM barrel protein [Vicinamibacteria bacterium]